MVTEATITLDKEGRKAKKVQDADTISPNGLPTDLSPIEVYTQEKSLANGCPAWIKIGGTWYRI